MMKKSYHNIWFFWENPYSLRNYGKTPSSGHHQNQYGIVNRSTCRGKEGLFFKTKLNKIGLSKAEISAFERKKVWPSPTTLLLKIEKNDS